jgi:hypothetical protein
MTREHLPRRRHSENVIVKWSGMEIQATVGYYEDGRPGEVFLDTDRKRGSTIDIAARDLGLLISLGLQHGCPLRTMLAGVSDDSLAGAVLRTIDKHAQEQQ